MKTFLFILLTVVIVFALLCTGFYVGSRYQLKKVKENFNNKLSDLGPSSRFRQGLEMAKATVEIMEKDFTPGYQEDDTNEAPKDF